MIGLDGGTKNKCIRTVNDIPDPAELMEEIREEQNRDPRLQKLREQVEVGLRTDVHIHTDNVLSMIIEFVYLKGRFDKKYYQKCITQHSPYT